MYADNLVPRVFVPLDQRVGLHWYADDTTLTSAAKDTDILQIKMSYDLNKIQTWLKANKLTLNVIGTRSKLASL